MGTCQECRRVGPTANIFVLQTIGLVVIRLQSTFRGEVCGDCGREKVKAMSLTTAFLGWWGFISFFFTPIALLTNLTAWGKVSKLGPALEGVDYAGPPVEARVVGALPATPSATPGGAWPQPTKQKPSKALSRGSLALGLALASIPLICIPVLPLISVVFAWLSRSSAKEEGVPVPARTWVAMTIGGMMTVLTGIAVTYALVTEQAKDARVKALETSADNGRSKDVLDAKTACELAEQALLERLYNDKTPGKVTCDAPLTAESDRAQLPVTATFSGETQTVTVCFRKASRWFVIGAGECAAGPLPAAVDPRAPVDEQEKAWRKRHQQLIAGEHGARVTQLFDGFLAELDNKDLPDCNAQHVKGLPRAADLLTVDADVLAAANAAPEEAWAFLNSPLILSALDVRGDVEARGRKAAELQKARHVAIVEGSLVKEPFVVKAKGDYVMGTFSGQLWLADLQTGQLRCRAELTFSNSSQIRVRTLKGLQPAKNSFKAELERDFTSRFKAELAATLSRAAKGAVVAGSGAE